MASIDLYIVQSNSTGSFWVKNEGFVATCKTKASKLTFKEANQLALQFWRAGTKQEKVCA